MVSPPSFFGRVTRYAPGPLSTPRENRLTEAFAAVLAHVKGDSLARAGLKDWGIAPRGAISLQTQVWSGGGRHVDLELRHGASVCWVEVKHGAPLHANQLCNYKTDLERRQPDRTTRHLVLLAPSGSMTKGRRSTRITARTGSVAVVLLDWLGGRTNRDAVHVWLIRQFLAFLEEERLAVIRPLDAEDLRTLARRRASEEVFAHVLGNVHDRLAARWRIRAEEASGWSRNVKHSWWPEGWEGWLPGTGFGRNTYIGWGVRYFDPPHDEPTVWCGLWFEGSATRSDPLANAEWVAKRQAEGFEVRLIGGECLVRLLRWKPIVGRSLDKQVAAIFRHITETDALLRKDPPFISARRAVLSPSGGTRR